MNNASFDENEIERIKSEKILAIQKNRDTPSSIAFEEFKTEIWKNTPYAATGKIYEKTIPNINKQDILDYYKTLFSLENLVISVNGNVDDKEIIKNIENIFCNRTNENTKKFEYTTYKNVFKPLTGTKTVKKALIIGVDKLSGIDKQYHIVLVVSSVTEAEKDNSIRKMLEKRGNVTIIDSYLENIQEIYQLSDVYLFPVQEVENCIDVPLSVLEAASCDLPIVTTEYGELTSFKNQEGFFFIYDLSPFSLNKALDKMIHKTDINNRHVVLEYDWKYSVDILQRMIKSGDKNCE